MSLIVIWHATYQNWGRSEVFHYYLPDAATSEKYSNRENEILCKQKLTFSFVYCAHDQFYASKFFNIELITDFLTLLSIKMGYLIFLIKIFLEKKNMIIILVNYKIIFFKWFHLGNCYINKIKFTIKNNFFFFLIQFLDIILFRIDYNRTTLKIFNKELKQNK